MTMNAHTAAAIAQIIFYVPVVPLSFYLFIANWRNGPRTAWYPPAPFSLIRLIGGILIIVEEQNPGNRGLITATIILLNLGLIPLILAFFGIVRLVLESNFKNNKRAKIYTNIIHYSIFIAVALLSVSGGLSGHPDMAHLQSILSKVAYFHFTSVLISLITVSAVLFFKKGSVRDTERKYLKWLLIATPALAVRTVYGLIGVFDAAGDRILVSTWSPLFGSATAFSLMALLPEYLVVCVYLYLGAHRLQTCRRAKVGVEWRGEELSDNGAKYPMMMEGENVRA